MTQIVDRMAEGRGFIHARSDDFDSLAESTETWGLDFRQLDAGPAGAELLQVFDAETHVQRARFGRSYDQAGVSPPGFRSFGILEEDVGDVSLFGSAFSDNELSVFGAAGEFEAASRPGFHCFTLSFSEARLAEAAELADAPAVFEAMPDEATLLPIDPKALSRLRRRIRRLIRSVESEPVALRSAEIAAELERDLPLELIGALGSASARPRLPRERTRDHALRRARSFMESRLGNPPTIQEVCREAGASWRTLDYAFRERYGVTPKRFLLALRLGAARRVLLDAEPGVRIADVSFRFGFWHGGQFAADYRRLFGELPSETVARRR